MILGRIEHPMFIIAVQRLYRLSYSTNKFVVGKININTLGYLEQRMTGSFREFLYFHYFSILFDKKTFDIYHL